MAKQELGIKASKDLWKLKKADAIAFEEGKNKEIPSGEYILGNFVATEGAIKNSDAVTFHYELGNGLKLYTKHINGTTVDDFDECYVQGNSGTHYIIPRNRVQNVLLSKMSELSGKKVRISNDVPGKKIKFVKGGFESKSEAKTAFDEGTADKIYKVEFL